MTDLRAPRSVTVLAASATIMLAACTGSTGGGSSGETSRAAHATNSDSTRQCVRADGKVAAHDGAISAGPFALADGPGIASGGGPIKLWVASSVAQAPKAATITADRLGPGRKQDTVRQRRGTDRLATPETKNPPALFYPGALTLPEPGTWRFTVTIGADTGCFVADVPGESAGGG